ncbi:MAG: diguanylate cyclase [Nitrospirae bacterium]|nr:diguanylate cyclase [Nitrospirota bacterium]
MSDCRIAGPGKTKFQFWPIVITVVMVMTGSFGFWLTAALTKDKTIEDIQKKTRQNLELFNVYLTEKIAHFSGYPLILAENSLIIDFCANQGDAGAVNSFLTQFNSSIAASVSYILNKDGVAIASSNWDSKESFIGKDYAFRQYYKKTIKGVRSGYVAMGLVSKEPGYYASYPVRKDGKVIGVAVVKNKLDSLKLGTEEIQGTLLIADENDVIFASNDDLFNFYTMRRLPDSVLSEIKKSKQYEGVDLVPLPVKSEVIHKGTKIITLSQSVVTEQREVRYVMEMVYTQENGWNVYLLSEIVGLDKKIFVNRAIAASVIAVIFIVVLVLIKVKVRKMKKKFIEQRKELERMITERTRELQMSNETLIESQTELEAAYGRMNDDMIELQRMTATLKESEERFRLIAESVSDVIWTLDASMDSFTYVSPSIAALRGFTVDEAVHEPFKEALTPASYAYARDILAQKLACFKESGDIDCISERIEVEQTCKDGRIIPVEVVISAITTDGGQIKEFVGISRDISERRKEEEKLKYRSTHDSMTGLYNRAYFDAELARIAHGRQFPVSFIVADLDGLKRVNDSIGHEAGDRLIKGAATVLNMAFRGSDVVARTGGDEFLIILNMTDEESAVKSIERIRMHQTEYNENNGGLPVSISLGMSTARTSEEIDTALKEADKRMYDDKVSRKQQRVG